MEVRIEVDEGCVVPEGCFVAVRVGEVQKQSKYNPGRAYRFPEKRRYAKVDIFQRVATCDLCMDTEQVECKSVGVTSLDPKMEGFKLKCQTTPVDQDEDPRDKSKSPERVQQASKS